MNDMNDVNSSSRSILAGEDDMVKAMDIMFTQGESQMTVQDGQGCYQGCYQGVSQESNATPRLSIQARLTGGRLHNNYNGLWK